MEIWNKFERSGTEDDSARDGTFTDVSCNEDESDLDWQSKVEIIVFTSKEQTLNFSIKNLVREINFKQLKKFPINIRGGG